MSTRIPKKIGLFVASLSFVALLGLPVGVFGLANSRADAATEQTTAVEAGGGPLTGGNLKACQNREKAITNIVSRIADRGQKQLNLFSSIADKTETFYKNKGKTLSNYDTLVADVDAKKVAAQTAVDTVKTDSVSFKCDGTDPKGAVSIFKDALKSEIQALKDYRTAVKNLIVGVKSVQGSTTSTESKTTGGAQ